MFPVIFFSLILSFVSMSCLIDGLWEHDMVQIKLSALAFFGWLISLGLSIVIAIKEKNK